MRTKVNKLLSHHRRISTALTSNHMQISCVLYIYIYLSVKAIYESRSFCRKKKKKINKKRSFVHAICVLSRFSLRYERRVSKNGFFETIFLDFSFIEAQGFIEETLASLSLLRSSSSIKLVVNERGK